MSAFWLILHVCFAFTVSPFVWTGQTVVTGKVTDAQTLEPIAFANVVFKGATYGAVTEFDGSYTLTGRTKSDSIIIVLIGYETKTIGNYTGYQPR